MKIRAATTDDISKMCALDMASATGARWNDSHYHQFFLAGESKGWAWMAEENGVVMGYLVAACVGTEVELENIVVGADAQRKGVATQLMNELLRSAREGHVAQVHLEVRESNLPARRLYAKVGFKESRKRPAYYSHPAEDAVVYVYSLR